jgi:hypothetical protein
MGSNRIGLDLGGLDDLGDFSPRPTTQPQPPRDVVEKVASFPSRESRGGRRRTGRTEQINIKARPDVVEQLYRIADQQRMVLGEVLEHALAALDRELGSGPT